MSKDMNAKKGNVEKLRVNEQKWSKTLMDAGWSAIPNTIIERQSALGLDPLDMNIIVHLSHYWWRSDNPPRPSVETIAKALGVSSRTIQKRVAALQELKLITRTQRRDTPRGSDTNVYTFEGLIEAARPFAEEKLAEIQKAAKAKAERLSRKKPRLVVVNNEE